MKISDELLMAYADDELTPQQRAEVERAMQEDAKLASAVERHRRLRRRLHDAFAPALGETVPDRLLRTLQAPRATNVVDLSSRRTKTDRLRWSAREWGAMAACLVAGVALGVYALNFNAGAIVARDGALVASRSLANALDAKLAADQTTADPVRIGISFRDRGGDYCRTFSMSESLAGLACKQGERWQVQLLSADTGSDAQYRQAGSETPAAVLTLVEQKIAGEPLNADGETAARAANWKAE